MTNVNKTKIKEELADEGALSGVELEVDSNEEYEKNNPFNPDDISITSKVFVLENVLRRIKNDTIRLSPDFQRNFVWNKKRKSQLIESMVLRIPLPMFYVSENRDGVWEVVDGLQRLSTIRDFVLGPEEDGKGDRLSNLEFWNDTLKGKDFFTLSNNEKFARVVNNIMESQLSFTVINPDTPEEVKRNIFKRINTGGMRLSDQEIRNALYQGKATKLLNTVVESEDFIKATNGSVNDSRMSGRELILRFLAFNILGRDNYKSNMDKFLSDTMRVINEEHVEQYDNVKFNMRDVLSDFKVGIERGVKIFGKHAFRNSTYYDVRRTPINKALFEVWINILSEISEDTFENILSDTEQFIEDYDNLLDDDDFKNVISRRAGSSYGARDRYEMLKELINPYD